MEQNLQLNNPVDTLFIDTSGLDYLVDMLAFDVYDNKTVCVAVDTLPFWIRRYITKLKKEEKLSCFVFWTMGEPTTCETEDKIEAYFSTIFPHATEIFFEANTTEANEITNILIELAESLKSKIKNN
jgi:hypothetical protein